jgi:hypothetical protein
MLLQILYPRAAGEGAHPGPQQEEERLRHPPLAEEAGVRLEQVTEEEKKGVQVPSFQPPPIREEARSEEGHHLRRPCPLPRDEECEAVHPRTPRPEGDEAVKEGLEAEPHRVDREQATEVGGLLERALQEHGRGGQQHGPFPQTA